MTNTHYLTKIENWVAYQIRHDRTAEAAAFLTQACHSLAEPQITPIARTAITTACETGQFTQLYTACRELKWLHSRIGKFQLLHQAATCVNTPIADAIALDAQDFSPEQNARLLDTALAHGNLNLAQRFLAADYLPSPESLLLAIRWQPDGNIFQTLLAQSTAQQKRIVAAALNHVAAPFKALARSRHQPEEAEDAVIIALLCNFPEAGAALLNELPTSQAVTLYLDASLRAVQDFGQQANARLLTQLLAPAHHHSVTPAAWALLVDSLIEKCTTDELQAWQITLGICSPTQAIKRLQPSNLQKINWLRKAVQSDNPYFTNWALALKPTLDLPTEIQILLSSSQPAVIGKGLNLISKVDAAKLPWPKIVRHLSPAALSALLFTTTPEENIKILAATAQAGNLTSLEAYLSQPHQNMTWDKTIVDLTQTSAHALLALVLRSSTPNKNALEVAAIAAKDQGDILSFALLLEHLSYELGCWMAIMPDATIPLIDKTMEEMLFAKAKPTNQAEAVQLAKTFNYLDPAKLTTWEQAYPNAN